MPKMKTKSGAKKRFRVTAGGKIKAHRAHKRHRLMSKPKSMKRKARGTDILTEMDAKVIRENFLPYSRKVKRKSNKVNKAKAGGA